MSKLRLGITIGDFNGIGPELVIRALSNPLIFNYCTPVVYASPYLLKHYASLLEVPSLDYHIVKNKDDVKEGQVNLRVCSSERITVEPGVASVDAGKYALAALDLAVDDIMNGYIQNIVTAPIDKSSTVSAGLEFNGHTEYFAKRFESQVQMILLNDSMRVAMVTGHTALNNVSKQLSVEKIVDSIERLNENLKSDFGISKPKIAVLGANPHSGDNGLMGTEEADFIIPAINQAIEKGILAVGPYPSDGLFGSNNVNNFDGILGMYHDQVLAPFKQIAFEDGVNYTAGLPIIRTSPDHGTAYDIAGKGLASLSSFINAIYLVNKVHRNRLAYYDSSIDPLAYRTHRREKFSIGVPNLK